MKCVHCGFESETNFSFCPGCGAEQTAAPLQVQNPAAAKILPALKDSLFLVICILSSVCCGLTLISSGPDVISILFTIFLWLVWAQAQKGVASVSHLRCISGTMYAQYVLTNVAAIFVIVLGVLFSLFVNVLVGEEAFLPALMESFADMVPMEAIAILEQLFVAGMGAFFAIVFAIVGVLILVINLFSNRYIHRFAQSVYKSVEAGQLELKHTRTVYGWLYAFGILAGLSCLAELSNGDVLVILSGGASCAMSIIAAILVKKYLLIDPAAEA